jgi:hypothetical protein
MSNAAKNRKPMSEYTRLKIRFSAFSCI